MKTIRARITAYLTKTRTETNTERLLRQHLDTVRDENTRLRAQLRNRDRRITELTQTTTTTR